MELKTPSQSLWTQSEDAAGPCCRKMSSPHFFSVQPSPPLWLYHLLCGSITSSVAPSPPHGSSLLFWSILHLSSHRPSLHPYSAIPITSPLLILHHIPAGHSLPPGVCTGPTLSTLPVLPAYVCSSCLPGFWPDSGRAIITPVLMLRDYSFCSAIFSGIVNGIYEEAHRL